MNPTKQGRVLVVDDEVEALKALVDVLGTEGYEAVGVSTAQEAFKAMERQDFDLILSDLIMPHMDGLALLKAAVEFDPNLVGIIMTRQATVPTAIEAMKIGALDYVLKPFSPEMLLPLVDRAMEVRRMRQENVQLRETAAISELCAAIACTLDQTSLLNLAADAAMEQVGADGVSIMLPTADGDSLYVAAVRGRQRDTLLGERVPLDQGVAGWVARHPEPLTLVGPVDDPRFKGAGPRSEVGSAMAMPMMVGGKVVGVLNINFTKRARARFTPGQVKALSILASTAAAALESARQYEDAQRHFARTQALRTIDLAIMSSPDVHLSLKAVVDQALQLMGVDAACVFRLNPYLQTLEYVEGRGFRKRPVTQPHVRLGEGIAGKAAVERRLIAIPNIAETEYKFGQTQEADGEEFVAYYAAPLLAKGKVNGVLELCHRVPFHPEPEWLSFLETLAGQAAIAIDNATLFDSLQRSNLELAVAYDATIEGWSRVVDLRDKETEGHTLRVAEMTTRLARAAGMSEAEVVAIRRGALLHDVGKMGVPDGILLKPDQLTDAEWEVMRQHPQLAFDLLAPITFLRPALDIPGCHHEHWDGTGYPRGLRGDQIPRAARLFAVVDVWDALKSTRPYRGGWPEDKVLDYIRAQAGMLFDPQAVDVFFRVMGEGN